MTTEDRLIADIDYMYKNYGFDISGLEKDQLYKFTRWRADFIQEELEELEDAIVNKDPEEIVDALIDIIVVSLGTLNLLQVDTQKAWDEVLRANLNKIVGEKHSRPNLFGFPDLIKLSDWTPPNHSDNHGLLSQ